MTKSAIDGLAVAEKDTVYWDQGLPGSGVKVTPRGRKVFLVMYRLGGAGSRLRKYTIGPYGRLTLPMARAQAQKIASPAGASAGAIVGLCGRVGGACSSLARPQRHAWHTGFRRLPAEYFGPLPEQ